MNRRFALAALPFLLALTPTLIGATPRGRAPVPVAPLPDVVRVAISTDLGTIELDLDARNAPVTVRNFVAYVDQRRYDGTVFYRVMRLAWGQQPNGLIQGGTRGDLRRDRPSIAHEPTSQTGILHKAGTISMARFAPGTAKGDFSIMISDLLGLDADPASANPDLVAGFAAFGRVSSGMEVVRHIWDVPLSPTQGQGVLKGQMIERPVRILTMRRVAIPALPPPPPPAP